MINFFEETVAMMERFGKTDKDILFFGDTEGWYIEWEDFRTLGNFDYDNGYGSNEIAMNLFIVFRDGTYLTRYEYDGSECWRFNKIPEYFKERKITKFRGTDLFPCTQTDVEEGKYR